MFNVGDLVSDIKDSGFSGTGKLVAVDEKEKMGVVGFFKSPLETTVDEIEVLLNELKQATLFEEQSIYCLDSRTNIWRRARYGGSRPDGSHLILYRKDDHVTVDISDIYVINLKEHESINPAQFLKARCVDTPLFFEWRQSFIRSYVEQRAACRSIASILSSSIELEPHQLAIVRRVLQDDIKKYLLADEVGLGKTIEAGLILRELLLIDASDTIAVVAVPNSLIEQWKSELKERFYLADLFDETLIICTYDELTDVLYQHEPAILIIDEAHHVASWAWSEKSEDVEKYKIVENAAIKSKACLLLSGTPLNGNELNLLSMLHLIAPDIYHLTEKGISDFNQRVIDRERLGGIYQALIPSNDNSTLSDLFDQINSIFPHDDVLSRIIGKSRSLVDFLADEEGEEREVAVKELRHYLGENYRLHQRLLRNRRDDPKVAYLFPGLKGALIKYWPISETALSVEQFLDTFRSEYLFSDNDFLAITKNNFIDWIEDSFVSPLLVVNRAKDIINNIGDQLDGAETDTLHTLIEFAELEQQAKDNVLLESITSWMIEHPNGKIVIFCSIESVGDHVSKYLQDNMSIQIERHQPGVKPEFCENDDIKIFVCDHYGEDGLNLNGGEKMVIHYSLPLSLSRIEQRLGRVNRYSAHIQAKPIQSLLILPESQSYSYRWQKILVEAVGIFNNTVASLQYILEDLIDKTWRNIFSDGLKGLDELEEKLSGKDGLLAIERQRVKAQEDLNKLDEDIELADRFAAEVNEEDSVAEVHAEMMFNWITKGLQFEKIVGEYEGTFRFRYRSGMDNGPRTLMDVKTLICDCLIGIDREHSNYKSPVTNMMSADRQIASHGRQIFPFRFGQPFVDVIYDSLRKDVRGICAAMLRIVSMNLDSPTAYFKTEWLLSKTERNDPVTKQRIGDEEFSPRIITHWLNQSGKKITNDKLLSLLDSPYYKKEGGTYQDKNLRPEYWTYIEEEFPEAHWPILVDNMIASSRKYLLDDLQQESMVDEENIHYELLGANVVFMVGG